MPILIKESEIGVQDVMSDCKKPHNSLRRDFSTKTGDNWNCMSGREAIKNTLVELYKRATEYGCIFICQFEGLRTSLYACQNEQDVKDLFDMYCEGHAMTIEFYRASADFFVANNWAKDLSKHFRHVFWGINTSSTEVPKATMWSNTQLSKEPLLKEKVEEKTESTASTESQASISCCVLQ